MLPFNDVGGYKRNFGKHIDSLLQRGVAKHVDKDMFEGSGWMRFDTDDPDKLPDSPDFVEVDENSPDGKIIFDQWFVDQKRKAMQGAVSNIEKDLTMAEENRLQLIEMQSRKTKEKNRAKYDSTIAAVEEEKSQLELKRMEALKNLFLLENEQKALDVVKADIK